MDTLLVDADVYTNVRIGVGCDESEMAPEWYLTSGIALPDSSHKERSRIVGKIGGVEW